MAILTPDKIRTENVGGGHITIKEKIIPDTARATRSVASWVPKGAKMKPCVKLNNGTGKPKGVTVHNTAAISVVGTSMAEQYTRATWPNQAMSGVVVHYYVSGTEIWQNLNETEQGWHAADGSNRRTDHRGNKTGGNMDTIGIEVIGSAADTEATTAKLVAYLCKKYALDPAKDVYTHNYWMYGCDKTVQGARKNCPLYILPHWSKFLTSVSAAYKLDAPETPDTPKAPDVTAPDGYLYTVQMGAYLVKANAMRAAQDLRAKGITAFASYRAPYWRAQCGAYKHKAGAEYEAQKMKAQGIPVIVTLKQVA